MLKFTSARDNHLEGLILTKIMGSNKWKVAEDFYFYDDYDRKELKIIIHKGFITDFGSIPRFLWIFLNPTKYISYVLHDYLYSKNAKYVCFDFVRIWGIYARKRADDILLEGMKIEGASIVERYLVFIAVRIFGGLFFNKK